MTILLVVLAFVAGQILASGGAALLGDLVIEESRAAFLEWTVSLALAAGCYAALLALGAGPALALALALAFAATQFALSRGAAWVLGLTAGIGGERDGLGPLYAIPGTALVLVAFVPTGLGPLLGAPDLYDGLLVHYGAAMAAGLALQALRHFLSQRSGEEALARVLQWALTLAVVGAAMFFARQATGERGRAAVACLILALALALLSSASGLFVSRVVSGEEWGPKTLAGEGKLLLASWGVVLVLWLAPV
ncbi:MAG: hypothetical protein HY720_16270 [Planctomycetes bacterium]|nr:hypothetical protein [Planctomycetota bacterium]